MRLPKSIALLHAPSGITAAARVAPLSDSLIREQMGPAWWSDDSINPELAAREIDPGWDWSTFEIERDGRILPSRRLAVLTDDGAVQGAMLLSCEPVPSQCQPGESALFIELLFAAPRNRRWLRRDGCELFRGVGVQLLRVAAELSLEQGLAGRLKLESCPGSVEWYQHRGLNVVSDQRILHQGVLYTPMELQASCVPMLLPGQ